VDLHPDFAIVKVDAFARTLSGSAWMKALTREISPGMQRCELTYLNRVDIDLELARRQHHAYEQALAGLGCQLVTLPAVPDLPDSVFVEDAAIVLDEIAVITRPGAASRRPETATIADALRPYRELAFIEAPGTIEGGDVLRIGKVLYIGRSSRSSEAGIEQLSSIITPYGYRVISVPVTGCLHLKSATTQVGAHTLLVNRLWVNPDFFEGMNFIDVDPDEPGGANALLIGETIIYPASYKSTLTRLKQQGIAVEVVDVSEVEKAEGAVTCCSLVFAV
jgi:dimethylargininase